ncbi:MAG: regulator of sigma protease, partial [Candidatus Eremiobacteraeota bacterium]|nr:regulator of sigma protease [Candidatus Eremiobacteraeota bacterium]
GGALIFGIPGNVPTNVIYQVAPDMPAAKAGMRAGDRIVSLDGNPVRDGNALVNTIHASTGKLLHIVFERDGKAHELALTPVDAKSPNGKVEGHLGFAPLPQTQRVGIPEAWSAGWSQFTGVIALSLGSLGALVTHPAAVAGQFQGPIGIARVSAQAQQFGPYVFLSLAGMISISLGIFNLLPIPALDGGRAVFILFEMLRGKPVDPEKEALVHVGGFAVLIALMLAVSFHDVTSAISGKSAF